jgi:hypothetical protein
MEVASAVSPSSSRTVIIRCSVTASRSLVGCQSSSSSCIRSSAPGRCAITPAGSASAANTSRTMRRHGFRLPRRGDRALEPEHPEPPGAGQVPAIPASDHPQSRGPGPGPSGSATSAGQRPVRATAAQRPLCRRRLLNFPPPPGPSPPSGIGPAAASTGSALAIRTAVQGSTPAGRGTRIRGGTDVSVRSRKSTACLRIPPGKIHCGTSKESP